MTDRNQNVRKQIVVGFAGIAAVVVVYHILKRYSQKEPVYQLNEPLPSSQLLDMITKSSMIAKKNGYLVSFESQQKIVRDNNIKWIATLALNLAKKPKPKISKQLKDPFMPPFHLGSHVCDLNKEYRLILNKYNVVPNHVLIITSKFVSQTLPLTLNDFKITMNVILSINGLCYFNCGSFSGASQPHKHIQVIPRDYQFPMEKFIKNIQTKHNDNNDKNNINLYQLKEYSFVHRVYLINKKDDAHCLYKAYCLIMNEIKDEIKHSDDVQVQLSYNMIMTADYIFIVPRTKDEYSNIEQFGDNVNISVNAVTFAGTFFCKSQDSLSMLEKVGPLTVLENVTFVTKK